MKGLLSLHVELLYYSVAVITPYMNVCQEPVEKSVLVEEAYDRELRLAEEYEREEMRAI